MNPGTPLTTANPAESERSHPREPQPRHPDRRCPMNPATPLTTANPAEPGHGHRASSHSRGMLIGGAR